MVFLTTWFAISDNSFTSEFTVTKSKPHLTAFAAYSGLALWIPDKIFAYFASFNISLKASMSSASVRSIPGPKSPSDSPIPKSEGPI